MSSNPLTNEETRREEIARQLEPYGFALRDRGHLKLRADDLCERALSKADIILKVGLPAGATAAPRQSNIALHGFDEGRFSHQGHGDPESGCLGAKAVTGNVGLERDPFSFSQTDGDAGHPGDAITLAPETKGYCQPTAAEDTAGGPHTPNDIKGAP